VPNKDAPNDFEALGFYTHLEKLRCLSDHREIQSRDFDALIAYTSIEFMRYIFLAYQCRIEADDRSFGDLLFLYCDEVSDILFIQALYRILTLAADR
jgi:hypothetical protein